jgi:hypothetical protein
VLVELPVQAVEHRRGCVPIVFHVLGSGVVTEATAETEAGHTSLDAETGIVALPVCVATAFRQAPSEVREIAASYLVIEISKVMQRSFCCFNSLLTS